MTRRHRRTRKTFACKIDNCTRSFQRKDDFERHYLVSHPADTCTEADPCTEAGPCTEEDPCTEANPCAEAERVDLFFKKEYPLNDPRGNASMRSFIDLLTRGHHRIDLHPSELGWNLPQDHARHILRFPPEILARILHFALVSPFTITPFCTRRQDRTIFEPTDTTGESTDTTEEPIHTTGEPTYYIGNHSRDEQQVLYRIKAAPNCKLDKGGLLHSRFEAEYRRPIDATVLRVCKTLHEVGQRMLYGKNTFAFDLEDNAYLPKTVQIMTDRDGAIVKKLKRMPESSTLETGEIQSMIQNLYSVRSPLDLPHMSCDPFVHFLFSIGQTNASYIRKLKISGKLLPISKHWAGYSTLTAAKNLRFNKARALTLNTSYFVKAYAPFISLYCPNLDKFIISIDEFISNYTLLGSVGTLVIGLKSSELEQPLEPLYNKVQRGDDKLDKDILREQRKWREEMRLRSLTAHIARTENLVASHLKPLLEKVTSNMPNLRTLEVTRFPPRAWNNNDELMEYNDPVPRDLTWVEMDLANDAKLAISGATRKRMQDAADVDGDKVNTLRFREEEAEN